MGKFGIDGVNGAGGVYGAKGMGDTPKIKNTYDFKFGTEDTSEVGLDTVKFSATKPAYTDKDLDKMWEMAGITRPDGVKPLEKTMAFAAEGAEY